MLQSEEQKEIKRKKNNLKLKAKNVILPKILWTFQALVL